MRALGLALAAAAALAGAAKPLPASAVWAGPAAFGTCVTLAGTDQLACFGGYSQYPRDQPLASDFDGVGAVSASLGFDSSCAILDGSQVNGRITCVGSNSHGQLGLGVANSPLNNPAYLVPVPSVDYKAISLASGEQHHCALFPNGQGACWGANLVGQLGVGMSSDRGKTKLTVGTHLLLLNMGSNETIASLVTGAQHTCALLASGDTKCFGWNAYGQLGQGSSAESVGTLPNQMGDALPVINWGSVGQVTQLALGSTSTCALFSNGKVKCLGNGASGQLGNDNTVALGRQASDLGDNLPWVILSQEIAQIASGSEHVCVLSYNGKVYCFGDGSQGELGNGFYYNVGCGAILCGAGPMSGLAPIAFSAGETIVSIACGALHTAALSASGSVWVWGDGTLGQLGALYSSTQPLPVLLVGSSSGTDSPTSLTQSPQGRPSTRSPNSVPSAKSTHSPTLWSTLEPTIAVTKPTLRPTRAVTARPAPSHQPSSAHAPTHSTVRPSSKSPTRKPTTTLRPVTTSRPISTQMPSAGRLPCDKCLEHAYAPNYTLACGGFDKNIDCTTLAQMWKTGVCRIASFCTLPSPVVVALVPYDGCPYLPHQPICQVVFNPSQIVNCLPLCFQSPHWIQRNHAHCYFRGFLQDGDKCVASPIGQST